MEEHGDSMRAVTGLANSNTDCKPTYVVHIAYNAVFTHDMKSAGKQKKKNSHWNSNIRTTQSLHGHATITP